MRAQQKMPRRCVNTYGATVNYEELIGMSNPTCSVEGCGQPVRARGWCNRHYARARRHGGDPLGGAYYRPGRRERALRDYLPCPVEECGGEAVNAGMCEKHYWRSRKHGDPTIVLRPNFDSPEESFAARTEWSGEHLMWTGAASASGHGRIIVDGKHHQAHRYAWERENGPIPEGLVVRHKCDIPPCVRIEHLELGTHQDNTNDMIARGRAHWQKAGRGK